MRRSSRQVGISSGAAPRRLAVGLVAICCALALPASALANNLFSLDVTPETTGPVVTEVTGNAYIAWEHKPANEAEAAQTLFCKIPRGGSCTHSISLPLPSPGTTSEESSDSAFAVLGTRPGVVYVVGERSILFKENETLIWTSTNGGESFSTPKVIDSYAGQGTVGDVLVNPDHTATEAKPTSDYLDVVSSHVGEGFTETGNSAEPKMSFEFTIHNDVYAEEPSLGFTAAGLPLVTYWELETPEQVHYFVNTVTPTDKATTWKGPETVTAGFDPRLASGPDGLFMLSADYLSGESSPPTLEVRKYNEATKSFGAPVPVAGLATELPADIFENPDTGALYVAWPVATAGGNKAIDLLESTDGGATFHGEREIAAVRGALIGLPRLAAASDGQGWLTFNDEGGLEVADLTVNTTLSTSLSGGGQSGTAVTVPQGTPVSDTASVGGSGASSATGSVNYEAFSNSSCTGSATSAGSAGVSGGAAGASSPVTLAPGKYYWRAVYSGDVAHQPSTSPCGSEVLTVLALTSTSTTQSGGGISGSSLTVPQGTSVTDQARIAGSLAASATGTVSYTLYKDSKCTVPEAAASAEAVTGGVGAPSAAVKPTAGTYYWKATYSGDAANVGSASACGSEVLVVALNATTLGLPSSKICLSKRHFLVHPRAPKGVKLVSIEVQINGKFVKKAKLSKHATTVSLVGLPKGTFKVALITTSSKGKIYEEARTFHTCVPGKHKKK
ncbi:MAG: hypothetical protein ABSG93_01985 [Solirubrobacteraceae bacterium]